MECRGSSCGRRGPKVVGVPNVVGVQMWCSDIAHTSIGKRAVRF